MTTPTPTPPAPTSPLVVSFTRIGRTHDAPALELPAQDGRTWDDVAEAIERHARPMLTSRFIEAVVHERPEGMVAGSILCGMNSGGTFTVTAGQ